MKARKVISYIWILVGALSTVLTFAQTPKPRLLPFPEVRLGPNGEGAEGSIWLSWAHDQQLFFVNGFLQGFRTGWKGGCGKSTQLAKTNLYGQCVDALESERSFEDYRNEATEFYTRYPEDLALPINRLFRKLLEPNMTIPQIHLWLNGLLQDSKKNEMQPSSN